MAKKIKVQKKTEACRLEDLFNKITVDFEKPTIEYIVSGSWRVWAHNWHIHLAGKTSYGSFCAYGSSPEEAARELLRLAKVYPVFKGNHCEEPCPNYFYDGY